MFWESKVYRFVRLLAFPILAFAIVLELDQFLPANVYEEVAEVGWQKSYSRRSSSSTLYSYMQTEHFVINVPDELHVSYDYWADVKEKLTITASPIFRIPLTVTYKLDNERYISNIDGTVYRQIIPLPFLLLASAFFIVFSKRYTPLNFLLSWLPIGLFVIILIGMES
jgi:hypothetical protein